MIWLALPTAAHLRGVAHDTPSKPLPSAPVGFGVGSICQPLALAVPTATEAHTTTTNPATPALDEIPPIRRSWSKRSPGAPQHQSEEWDCEGVLGIRVAGQFLPE